MTLSFVWHEQDCPEDRSPLPRASQMWGRDAPGPASSAWCTMAGCTVWNQVLLRGLALPCLGRELSLCPPISLTATCCARSGSAPAPPAPSPAASAHLPTPGDHSLPFPSQPPAAIPIFVLSTFPWRHFSAWVPHHFSVTVPFLGKLFNLTWRRINSPWRELSVQTRSACCPLLPAPCSFPASSVLPLLLVTLHVSLLLPAHPYFWPFPLGLLLLGMEVKVILKPKRPSQCKVILDCTHSQEIPNHTGGWDGKAEFWASAFLLFLWVTLQQGAWAPLTTCYACYCKKLHVVFAKERTVL